MATSATGVEQALIDGFRETLRGELIRPGDSGFDEARAIYDAMIDKRPGLIAECTSAADVIAAVNLGREHELDIAIRSGGHNGPGLALVEDGLVIDLSEMTGIRVDPDARTVRVEAGCTWGDVDHATHPFGLATVSGIISTTGVGGLTLGGGHGYLTRKHGLTVDNLLSADVVLADGSPRPGRVRPLPPPGIEVSTRTRHVQTRVAGVGVDARRAVHRADGRGVAR